MIGKIYTFNTPYYDRSTHQMSFKRRPALILSGPRSNDYTVLPVSKVTDATCIDPHYDIKIDPSVYPLSGLNCVSYVRIHKQTVLHRGSLGVYVGDLKTNYGDLYLEILERLEEFNSIVIDDAI